MPKSPLVMIGMTKLKWYLRKRWHCRWKWAKN